MSADEPSVSTAAALARGRAVPWYAFAGLCLAGASVGALSLVLPHPSTSNMPVLWINTGAAFLTAALSYVLGRRGVGLGWTHPFVVGGSLLIANATYQSGDGASYYAAWFVWIAAYAYSFYGRRAAGAHFASVAGIYAVVLALLDGGDAVGRWATTITTLVITAAFIDFLVRGLRRHAQAIEQLMARLEADARTDELTGLPNRRSWDAELHRAVTHARRFELPLAVAVLDLDRFKALNDGQGHAAGDVLLRDAAREWSSVVREVDTLARWGGDEFGLLITGCDLEGAVEVVERIRAMTPAQATCSAGLVVWNGDDDEAALMARADDALYQAKRAGRDRLVVAGGDALLADR